ncbi:hypothetical protein MPSEU_000260300 [Mayamaea pseudoterrestris]|nr:hypothetical protein MPSEU_000260300 [Mayamaea pseudoterrestris]
MGPGIADFDCFSQGLGSEGEGVSDFVPVRVSSVDIIELDQSLAPIGSSFYGEGYANGDTIQYVSIAGNPTNVSSLSPAQIPKAIQMSIVGTNVVEEDITNVWIILFDNECGFFQVLQTGDQIGWTKLLGLEAPLEVVCPAASPEPTTEAPTSSNLTPAPTIMPTTSATIVTEEPTASVEETPTFAPLTRRPTVVVTSTPQKPTCPPARPLNKRAGGSIAVGSASYSASYSGSRGTKRARTRSGKGRGDEVRRLLQAEHTFYEERVGDHIMSMSFPDHAECFEPPALPEKKQKKTGSGGGSKRAAKIQMPVASKGTKGQKSSTAKGAAPKGGKNSDSVNGSVASSGSYKGSASSSTNVYPTVAPPTPSEPVPTTTSSPAVETEAPVVPTANIDTKAPTTAPTVPGARRRLGFTAINSQETR